MDPQNFGGKGDGHSTIKKAFGNDFYQKEGMKQYYEENRNTSIMRDMMFRELAVQYYINQRKNDEDNESKSRAGAIVAGSIK